MTPRVFRRWSILHTWTSLICTLFLLIICITGLPLVFRDEIGDWLSDSLPYAMSAENAPTVRLDTLTAVARQRYPGQIITSVFVDDDEPQVLIGMAPSWERYNADPGTGHALKFDAHTGAVLRDMGAPAQSGIGFLQLMLRLHVDLFAGLTGNLFLGVMGLSFVLAMISGLVLYAPFMKRLTFGTIRTGREKGRLAWLDLHNLSGVVLAVWMGVVGLTGVMNELSTPLFALWQRSDVQAMLRPWQGQPAVSPSELMSAEAAFHAAQAAVPDRLVVSAVFPGSRFGTPYHYFMWSKGRAPLTGRLFTPILVDARTGKVSAVVAMPWYLRALEVSRPLHFGDYGGTPLKILWVLFDLVTIVVLVTGLVLWFRKRSRRRLSSGTLSRAVSADPDDTLEPIGLPHTTREATR